MSAEGSAAYQQALAGAGLGDALLPWHAAFADAGREALAPTRALAALQPTLDDNGRHRAIAIAREHDARRFVDPSAIDARAAERLGERPRAEGVYYTPRIVARALATLLREARVEATGALVDPACGAGALLAAALEDGAPLSTLYGVDLDPIALEIARCRLILAAGRWGDDPCDGRARFVCADTLGAPLDALFPEVAARGGFDALIANPPFGGAIARDTGRTDEERARYARDFPHAARGAYDRAALFVERALQWTRPGGAIAALVPRALLGAPSAAALRAWIESERPLRAWLRVDDGALFRGASVYVAGISLGPARPEALEVVELQADGALTRATRDADVDPSLWAARTSPYAEVLGATQPSRPLGELARVRASLTVGEAYPLAEHVHEEGEAAPPVRGQGALFEPDTAPGGATPRHRWITSGAVDPLAFSWGARAQRYLGRRLLRPVIDAAALPPKRAALAAQPKVLLPGLSAVLEAAHDPDGAYAGAVASLSITALEEGEGPPLPLLALYLNTASARAWYLAHYAALALAGGSVQVTANKLRALPVPDAIWRGPRDDAEGARLLALDVPALARKRPPPLAWWGEARALAGTARPSAWRGALWLLAGEQARAGGERTVEERLSLASVAVLGCARDEDDDAL